MRAPGSLACAVLPRVHGDLLAVRQAHFLTILLSVCLLLTGCVMPREATRSGASEDRTRLSPPAPGTEKLADADRPAWRGSETPHQGDPWLLGISPSFLPNLGLAATVAREVGVWRDGGLAVEAEFTEQFIDDTSFTDSQNPEAGNWTQAKLGMRWAKPYDIGRWFTLRSGGVWFRARGRPNIINDAGDYYGVFVELGLEVRLGKHLIAGPGISTMFVLDEEDHQEHVVPMVTWRFLYTP